MIFILIFFVVEFLISIKFGISVGFGWSIVWILFTSALGYGLLRLSPYAIAGTFNNIAMNKFNPFDAQNAALSYMLGSILLIIPGVFSDILGVVLIFYTLYLNFFARIPKNINNNNSKGDSDVIDVEIIDSNSNNNSSSNSKL